MASPVDGAIGAVKNAPRGVVIGAVAIGGGIGVIYLIRNRAKPAPVTAADSPVVTDPSTGDPIGTPYVNGGYGGASPTASDIGTTDPTTSQGFTLADITSILQEGISLGQGSGSGGGQNSSDPTGTGTVAPTPSAPPPAAPIPVPKGSGIYDPNNPSAGVQTAAPAAPKSSTPANKPKVPKCGGDYPHESPTTHACYRIVFKGAGKTRQTWHYYKDGHKVRIS